MTVLSIWDTGYLLSNKLETRLLWKEKDMVFTNETNIEEKIGQHSLVDPDDPCNSYEWSILYLLLLIVASLGISFEFYVMYRRKEDLLLSAFDIGNVQNSL